MILCETSTPAKKRYERRVMVTMAIYLVVLFAAIFVVKHTHPHGWLLYLISVLPALPIFAMLGSMGVYLQEEKDEYIRLMTMRSLVVGTAVLLAVLVVSDFLRAISGAQAMAPFASWVTFFLAFGAAQWIQKMRNRVATMRNRIRELRLERNMSQADLAERLEVSRQSVNAIETGKYDPSLPLAFKLARVFGRQIDTMFDDGEVKSGLPIGRRE